MTDSPQPIDTSRIALSPDLEAVAELLARHVHARWAQLRLSQGWRYGPQRDDQRKETPDLVPYDELTEAEKDADRTTALETIKVLLALGYKIEKG